MDRPGTWWVAASFISRVDAISKKRDEIQARTNHCKVKRTIAVAYWLVQAGSRLCGLTITQLYNWEAGASFRPQFPIDACTVLLWFQGSASPMSQVKEISSEMAEKENDIAVFASHNTATNVPTEMQAIGILYD